MKREHVFVAAALGVGLLYWLVDATVEYVAFHLSGQWGSWIDEGDREQVARRLPRADR